VIMKSAVFWDVTLCSPIYRRFREMYCLHLQGWRLSQENFYIYTLIRSGIGYHVSMKEANRFLLLKIDLQMLLFRYDYFFMSCIFILE
jgi:hypothetical protein